MQDMNERKREAVGNASRVGLPARGDAYCESADESERS